MSTMFKAVLRSACTLAILWQFVPGVAFLNVVTLLLASVVLSIMFGLIRPFLSVILMPINFVTFGLANLAATVGLLWLVQYLVPGFMIAPLVVFGVALNQFFTLAFVAALITLISGVIRKVF